METTPGIEEDEKAKNPYEKLATDLIENLRVNERKHQKGLLDENDGAIHPVGFYLVDGKPVSQEEYEAKVRGYEPKYNNPVNYSLGRNPIGTEKLLKLEESGKYEMREEHYQNG